jgi:hypothetical protein
MIIRMDFVDMKTMIAAKLKTTKKQRILLIGSETLVASRTTPNNIFLVICGRRTGFVLF